MSDGPLDDALVPVAFSLTTNPGGYAVLAGAGVSLGAGLPSAWGIMTALADQVRELVDPDAARLEATTVAQWWSDQYGQDVTYSGLFDKIARTKVDRETLLREHIEVGDGPGLAHQAIARLVQLGVIKIIVTLNFDHLFEDALRALGIEPRVISTGAAAASARPLHTGDPVVVHLHGDYRDAASMLNTPAELRDGYGENMRDLVARVVADHGLLIAGWSADNDPALCQLVQQHYRGYYRPVWITPGDPREVAASVIASIDAQHIAATADDAFGRIADAVTALRRLDGPRHPLTPAVVADRIRRDLTNDRPAITAHDTFADEATMLEQLPALTVDNFHHYDGGHYVARIESINDACRPIVAATAVLAYWGTETADEWWMSTLAQWSRRFDSGGGSTSLIDLPFTVAVRLFYAAGVSLTAARRYDAVGAMAAVEATAAEHGQPEPAARVVDWDRSHPGLAIPLVDKMRTQLATDLGAALNLSPTRIDTAWQEFETIRAAAQILLHPNFTDQLVHEVTSAAFDFDSRADQPQTDMKRASFEKVDELRGRIGSLPTSRRPHVQMDRQYGSVSRAERWGSRVAQHLIASPDVHSAMRPLAGNLSANQRTSGIGHALAGAATYFQFLAGDRYNAMMPVNSVGFLPNTLWLDHRSDSAPN